MPLHLIRNDITLMHVDAIVNAANKKLAGGSGVNGAIHRAAGPELLQECLTLGGCKTGEAKITGGYDLPCRYVIHTVGPVWRGGWFGEKEKLAACYWNALELAYRNGCGSMAFPLISSGVFGYPKDQALRVAVETISAYLLECEEDLDVYLVMFGKEAMHSGSKLFANIQQYIDDNYVAEHVDERCENIRARQAEEEWNSVSSFEDTMDFPPVHSSAVFEEASCWRASAPSTPGSLEDALDMIDESFSEMVLRKIKEKGMKNAECYKKANLDKKHFSKLANDIHYKPRKTTAVALAIALELDLDETRELLMKAGFALSKSDRFDIIVEYFISRGMYDIFEINEALFYYDQALLGSVVA